MQEVVQANIAVRAEQGGTTFFTMSRGMYDTPNRN